MEFNVNNIDFEIFGENGLTNRTQCYCKGEGGAAPFMKDDVILRAPSGLRAHPQNDTARAKVMMSIRNIVVLPRKM